MEEQKRKITLKVDPERITVDDLIAIEEGTKKVRLARDLVAKFVIDEDGNFLSDEAGKAFVGKLSVSELMKVATQLAEQVQEMMGDMVPTKTAS